MSEFVGRMKHNTPWDYETKFADFIKLCENAKTDGTQIVVVAAPWVIGDTYDEAMESLSRLANAGLALRVAAL